MFYHQQITWQIYISPCLVMSVFNIHMWVETCTVLEYFPTQVTRSTLCRKMLIHNVSLQTCSPHQFTTISTHLVITSNARSWKTISFSSVTKDRMVHIFKSYFSNIHLNIISVCNLSFIALSAVLPISYIR
jgi:hypothetical protein